MYKRTANSYANGHLLVAKHESKHVCTGACTRIPITNLHPYVQQMQKPHEADSRQSELRVKTKQMRPRFVLCKCHSCIVPVGSNKYNIYAVASVLEEKGWNLATGQNPPYLGICIGERHSQILDSFEEDLRSTVAFLDGNPSYKPAGAAAVYGAMSTTPTAILEEVVKRYVDMRLWVKPKADSDS